MALSAIAIVGEVIATSALKSADGFTRLLPSLIVVVGYGVSFYFISLSLRAIPVGVAYAIWAGVGVALVSFIAWIFLGQSLDKPTIAGLVLIIAGVVVLRISPTSVTH